MTTLTAAFHVIGWPVAAVCLVAFGWRVFRMTRVPKNAKGRVWREPFAAANWLALLLWAGGAAAALTLAGAVKPALGWTVFGVAAAIIVAAGRVWKPEGRHALRGQVKAGIREPAGAARGLIGWLRDRHAGRGRTWRPGMAGDVDPVAAVADYTATRTIPPMLEDGALGPPAAPAEITAVGAPIPAPFQALIEHVGSFEPGDDLELRMFFEALATGQVALAEAWHAFADTCLNSVRLSPAFIAGVLEVGDHAAEHAALQAHIYRRFLVVYAEVKAWVDAHGHLPKDGDFLSGEGEAA